MTHLSDEQLEAEREQIKRMLGRVLADERRQIAWAADDFLTLSDAALDDYNLTGAFTPDTVREVAGAACGLLRLLGQVHRGEFKGLTAMAEETMRTSLRPFPTDAATAELARLGLRPSRKRALNWNRSDCFPLVGRIGRPPVH